MILHHESFFPRVPLKLHSRHLLHVISIHRLYAALLIMKLHQELAVRFTQENVFSASPAVTHTLCALSDLMHLLLTQGSHLTVPPTAIYSSQATAMTYVLISSHEACSHFPNAQTQLSTFQFLPRTNFAAHAVQLAPPAHVELKFSAHSAYFTLQVPVHRTLSSAVPATLYVQTLFMYLNLTPNPMLLLMELSHNWTACVSSISTQNPGTCSGSPPLVFALPRLPNHRNDVISSSLLAADRLSHELPHIQHAHFGKCLKVQLLHRFSLWYSDTCGLRFASHVHMNFSLPVNSRLHLTGLSGVNDSDSGKYLKLRLLHGLSPWHIDTFGLKFAFHAHLNFSLQILSQPHYSRLRGVSGSDSGKRLKLRLLLGFSPWHTDTCGLRFAFHVHLNSSLPVISQLHSTRLLGASISDSGKCLELRPLHGFSPWFTDICDLNFSFPAISRPHLPRLLGRSDSDTRISSHTNAFGLLHLGASKIDVLTTADTAPGRFLNCFATRMRSSQPNAACYSSRQYHILYHSEQVLVLRQPFPLSASPSHETHSISFSNSLTPHFAVTCTGNTQLKQGSSLYFTYHITSSHHIILVSQKPQPAPQPPPYTSTLARPTLNTGAYHRRSLM